MPNDTQGSETQENKPSAEEQMGNMVNAAVKQHVARFIKNEFPALIGDALKPVLEQVAAAQAAPPAEEVAPKGKAKQDPEYLALQKSFEDLKTSLATSEKARVDAENKAREERAYGDLRSGLEGKVRPELLDVVAKYLFVAEKRVEFGEDGAPLFKTQRTPFAGADPEDVRLPLRAGIDEFMKSEAAKPFLPAPGTAGAGPLPKSRNAAPPRVGPDFSQPAGSDAEKASRAFERERMVQEKLGRQ
jgi:hypothetical protein